MGHYGFGRINHQVVILDPPLSVRVMIHPTQQVPLQATEIDSLRNLVIGADRVHERWPRAR